MVLILTSIHQMAVGHGISDSGEKRLRLAYPDHYPRMFFITPGRLVATQEDADAFTQWLIDTPIEERGGEWPK